MGERLSAVLFLSIGCYYVTASNVRPQHAFGCQLMMLGFVAFWLSISFSIMYRSLASAPAHASASCAYAEKHLLQFSALQESPKKSTA